ncbi:lasso peptide biosynthesis B2 protein [Blastomonas sp. AAP53]|uniref:lasso peptide biosynthesis B2 protein n=1 Tax=Blastomonas sp. AAP53 TaxID=1248760 RepID=UPI00187C3384|nr:lasso peptide biosynthesis B2 protein [Blastomonas sp. AAP53]
MLQDEYLAIPRDSAANVLSALADEPHDQLDPTLTELLESRFLVDGNERWHPHTGSPPASLPDPVPLVRPYALRLLVIFLLAVAQTYLSYRRGEAIASLSQRSNVAPTSLSPNTMAAIMAHFTCLRCLVPGSGRCLIQSMLLTRFLGHLGISPELVFGVRTHPFEAHCWVEWDAHVLNDSPDHVCWFTVIARF